MTTPQLILSVASFLAVTLVGLVIYWQRKTQNTVEKHDTRITRLEENIVTADEVRSIVHQGNEPMITALNTLREELAKNNSQVQTILLTQAERRGYEQAIEKIKSNSNK